MAGPTKGKRWRKGQSSVSNPATRKFRDAARGQYKLGTDMRDKMADEVTSKVRISSATAAVKKQKVGVRAYMCMVGSPPIHMLLHGMCVAWSIASEAAPCGCD